MRTFAFFSVAVLCSCSALLAGCGARRQAAGVSAAAAPSPRAPWRLETFEIRADAAPTAQRIPAVIASDRTALVLSQRDGLLIETRVQEGDRVSPGQELARLNEDDLRAQLRQAQIEGERLGIEERQYESLVKVSRTELAQEEALFKDGLNSQRQLDRAKYKLEEAQHEYDKARLASRTGQAKAETIRLELDKTVIRAPFGGVITHRYAGAGTNIVRNDKLFEIAAAAPLEVKFQLPQADAGRVRAGDALVLALPGDDRAIARARVERTDPIVNAAGNSVGYHAELRGGEGLRIGAAVDVLLAPAPAAPTIWVPLAAFPHRLVPAPNSAQTVLVLENGRAAARSVAVREVEGGQAGIAAGLRPGDRLLLAPPPDLKPGDPVDANSDRKEKNGPNGNSGTNRT